MHCKSHDILHSMEAPLVPMEPHWDLKLLQLLRRHNCARHAYGKDLSRIASADFNAKYKSQHDRGATRKATKNKSSGRVWEPELFHK